MLLDEPFASMDVELRAQLAKDVRRILDGDEPHHPDLWQGIAELGWLGASIPEEYGGLGLGYLELCVIAEELGAAIAPVPFSSTVYLFTEALLQAGVGFLGVLEAGLHRHQALDVEPVTVHGEHVRVPAGVADPVA